PGSRGATSEARTRFTSTTSSSTATAIGMSSHAPNPMSRRLVAANASNAWAAGSRADMWHPLDKNGIRPFVALLWCSHVNKGAEMAVRQRIIKARWAGAGPSTLTRRQYREAGSQSVHGACLTPHNGITGLRQHLRRMAAIADMVVGCRHWRHHSQFIPPSI